MKTITKNIALFIITLGILSSPFSVHAATWVGPTATPPGNNVSAPVNVGGTYQIKAGDLGVISLFANYIKSLGTISANRYCFNNGTANGRDQSCITSWPAGGTGGGIQSIVAGTNVTVDNTDPLNPVISSTATGGSGGTPVAVQKDGTVVVANPSFLNFTGQQVSAVPDGVGVKIAVSGTPVRLNNTQITASPTALNFTGLNMAATVTGGIVNIAVTPTAVQKDGIQVSAAPLAVNFVGDNITATNTGGIVSVGVNKLTVQQNDTTIGSNFTGINFVGGNDWVVTNGGGGIARIENVGSTGPTGPILPPATPADKILRSDGTNWVQSPLVKHTASSFQVNRPVADNSTDNIFQAAKMINILGNPIPALGLFVTQQGDTYVNGAKFRNYYNGGTTATPTNSFGADDIFQVTTNASNTGSGLAVRGDAKVRVRGELSALNNAVVPLSAGLFLGANDIFHVVGELNGAKKGFGLAVDGTTRVEGLLAVNGGEAIFGDRTHVGNTTQTGNATQIGNYTMEGPGATMTLGNSTNSAYLDITGNSNQLGNQYQTGNLTQLGNVSQTGDYSLVGNIAQTGNINTNGRWAVIDTAAPGPGPQMPGAPILYSFLASVGPGGNFGTFGIDRAGKTRVVGSLQVTGPINATGNLAIDGWIQTDTLMNSSGDAPVCADTLGRLKICAAPTPVVDITSTGLSNNSFTTPLLAYTSGQTSIPNPNVTTNVSYTISGASGGSNFSCQRTSSPSGNVSGWNTSSAFTVTTPAFTDTKTVTINSYTPTQLNVVCQNLDGQTGSDLATITGHGSWTTGTGTSGVIGNFTFPSVQLSVEILSGGGGGGGSLIESGMNACGGGGGAGEYKSQSVFGGTYYLEVGAGGAGGQPNYLSTFGGAGGYGGDTRFGYNVTLLAEGGAGGLGGRKTPVGSGWAYQGGTVASYHGVGGSSGSASSICTFGVGKVPSVAFNSSGAGGRGGWSGSIPNGFGLAGQSGSIRVSW